MEEQAKVMLNQLAAFAVHYAADVLGALILFVVGWIAAGWVKRIIRRGLDRSARVDEALKGPIAGTARYAVLIMVIVAVLAQFGVQIASLLAVLGAIGLAIGLALQGTLSNVAAGIMLLFLRPFHIGDYIDAEGIAGTIREIGLFTSELHTYDGIYMSVPNSQLWNHTIKNFSRLPTRRLDLVIGIGYDDDMQKALDVLMEELKGDPRVLADPAPQTMVKELADSSVNINVRCWSNASDYWGLLFDFTKRAKERLDQEGISIPFPQRDVHIDGAPLAAGAAGEGDSARRE